MSPNRQSKNTFQSNFYEANNRRTNSFTLATEKWKVWKCWWISKLARNEGLDLSTLMITMLLIRLVTILYTLILKYQPQIVQTRRHTICGVSIEVLKAFSKDEMDKSKLYLIFYLLIGLFFRAIAAQKHALWLQ